MLNFKIVRSPYPVMAETATCVARGYLSYLFLAIIAWGCSNPVEPPPPALALTCSGSVDVQSTDGKPVTVSYPAPVISGGKAPVSVTCSPVSGSSFPIATSTVRCDASDAAAQRASCDLSVTVRPPTPRISGTNFLAFGDSITAGVVGITADMRPQMASVSYPARLQALLAARYTNQTIVMKNAGKGAEAAVDGALRLPYEIAAASPDVLLLLQGVVDLCGLGEKGIALASEAVATMTRHARATGARVFLGTLLQQRAGALRACSVPWLVPFNDELKRIAAREGAELVDLYTLVELPLIGADGLHPTEAGYQRIAEIFFDSIRRTMEVPITLGASPMESAGR
jgi:lysophospholipase L1-like esterase